jgi:ATP-dependent Clp protease ATP-binding subunit ClpB
MRLDRLTVKSQEALQEAQTLAQKKGNQQLDVEHLLLAIIQDNEGIGLQILNRIGADSEALKADLDREIDKFPKVTGATPMGQLYIAQRLKDVLEKSFEEAQHLTDEFIKIGRAHV